MHSNMKNKRKNKTPDAFAEFFDCEYILILKF